MKRRSLLAVLFAGMLLPAIAQTTIAVLPYKISYEGRVPKKLTPEQVTDLQEQDGRNYQANMINSLTRKSIKRSNLALDVTVLSQGQIEALLLQHNISDEQLDRMTNEQLADSLGVSHVVRGSATRTFIMSDEMSLGITAIGVLTNQSLMNITSNINIINALEESNGGTVFSRQFIRSTSALRSDDQSLRDTFRKSARKMFRNLREQ